MKKLIAMFGILALAACAGDDEVDALDGEATATTTEVITETDTTMAPVVAPVVTQDTGLVETTTTIDTDVDVDTVVRP